MIPPDATSYANRDGIYLFNFISPVGIPGVSTELALKQFNSITSILTNKVYGGDWTSVRGYHNYHNPIGNPNWRQYYWGDNYEALSEIKAKYDGTNMFGNPLQVQPAIPSAKTVVSCDNLTNKKEKKECLKAAASVVALKELDGDTDALKQPSNSAGVVSPQGVIAKKFATTTMLLVGFFIVLEVLN